MKIGRTALVVWTAALVLWGGWVAREYHARSGEPLVSALQYELSRVRTNDSDELDEDGNPRLTVRALVHVSSTVADVDFELEERDGLHPAGAPTTRTGPMGTILDVPFEVVPLQQRKASENQLPLAHARFFLGAGGDVCPVPKEATGATPVTVAYETPRAAAGKADRGTAWQVSALSPDGWRRSRDLGGIAVLALSAEELERSLLFVGPVVPLAEPYQDVLLSLAPRDQALLATLRECASRLDVLGPETPGCALIVSQTTSSFHVPVWSLGRSHLSPVSDTDPASVEDAVTRLAYSILVRRFELPPERAWWLHGIARRVAVEIVAEVRGRPARRAWRDRLASYVFHSATQDGPLSTPNPTGHRRHCLLDLKAPLLIRRMEERNATPVGAADWRSFLERLAAGESEDDALREAVGAGALAAFHENEGGDRVLQDPRIARDLSLAPRRESDSGAESARLVLALTANTENYLETCGCKLRQQGGIARRATALAQAAREAPLLALDLGNLAPRMLEPFQVDKLVSGEVALHLQAAAGMGYAGFALGPNELLFGEPWIAAVQRASAVRFQACNVLGKGEGAPEAAPWSRSSKTVRVGDIDVRLIALTTTTPYWIAPEELARHLGDVTIEEPLDTLERELASSSASELTVVYGQIPPWKIAEIVARFPEIDVVASSDRWVPPGTSERTVGPGTFFLASGFAGDTFVALANEESHGLASFDLTLCADGRIGRYAERLVTLDENLPEDPVVRADMDALYASIALEGFHPKAKKLFLGYPGERALLVEGAANGRRGYIGAEVCRGCHAPAYEAWSQTPHATAFRTLVDQGRDRAPACVGCHVVGFGLPTGYEIDRAESAHLRGVQCEACHGPGAEHVNRPHLTTIRPTIPVEACSQCHDAEHSEPLAPRLNEALVIGAHRPDREPSRD